MASKDLVIVVVPGGMGSTLSLGTIKVWDFKPPTHLEGARMINDPALLLPWLTLKPGHLLSLYNGLKRFFQDHGYVTGDDLFLFPYDWRRGMEVNAQALADFVNTSIDLTKRKLVFVAHSCGCMIVRWALLFPQTAGGTTPMIDNSLVETVVAAGPPMLGMARPFKDLVQMPRINDTFDQLFALVQATIPKIADLVSAPINKALMAVTAQLESLTPNDIPMLSGGSTPTMPPFGVFDWKGWPTELNTLRAAVRATHARLESTAWPTGLSCNIIASQSTPTETGYVLDANDEYSSDWQTGAGDDSVLLTSAQAYCPSAAPTFVTERHKTLLDDPAARSLLTTII